MISAENLIESEEIENTYYFYSIPSQISDDDIVNMITNGTGNKTVQQYLAFHTYVLNNGNYISFGVGAILYGELTAIGMYDSYDKSSNTFSVRPVVTLESNAQLEGNSEDGWTIK